MKKAIKYILCCLIVAVTTACINEPAVIEGETPDDDGLFVLDFAVQIPDAAQAMTRAFGEAPEYDDLQLWCVVFQDNGSPAANYLTQVVQATHTPGNSSGNGVLIPFEVSLLATEENAVIHFIAINAAGLTEETNPMFKLDYGPENVVIPRLKTSGGRDAYWQRIALGCPIMNDNREQIEQLVSTFSPVPLIRNFAKISIEVSPGVQDFNMTGFCVVNTLDSGTVAPYNDEHGFPSFVETLPFETGSERYKPYNYYEITTGNKIVSQDSNGKVSETTPIEEQGYPYIGVRPGSWKVIDKNPTDSEINTEPKYIYERPFSETDHTYIIIKGNYTGDTTDSYKGETYYKIDIGQSDEEGIFRFHNILRNFNYKMVITGVRGSGYKTIQEAVIGNIYNNNISAAVETQHLLNISDGTDLMFVNFTSYVMVTGDKVKLKYRYYDLKDDNTNINESQLFDVVDYKVEHVTGQAFTEASIRLLPETETDYNGENERIWQVLEITPNTPQPEMQVSQILLYRPHGLSRRITFYLQTPWKFDGDINVYPGQHDHREANKTDGLTPGIISDQPNKPFTIFFKLPIGLPKAMFPLQFIIESNRQNLENDKNGTIVVQSGPSLFDNVSDIRIQYVKTVTWSEYDPDNKGDADSTTDNYDSQGQYIGNVVRCRFLTTTDLSDTNDSANPVTTVLIDNPYFVRGKTTFTRSSTIGDVPDDSTDNGN